MTLSQNIGQAIIDFKGIRQAIEEQGIEVITGTPTRDYADLTGEIIGGGSNWGTFTGTAAFNIQKGDMALGAKANDTGDFTLNLQIPSMVTGDGQRIAFSPDGRYMATVGGSPGFNIYKIENGVFTKLPNPSVMPAYASRALAFSVDSKYLIVGYWSDNGFIRYSIGAGDVFTNISTPGVSSVQTKSVAFSPDGRFFALGANGSAVASARIQVVKMNPDSTVTLLPALSNLPGNDIIALKFSPDSKYLAWGTSSNFVGFHSIVGDTFTYFTTLTASIMDAYAQVQDVTFSPDGNYLAFAMNGPNDPMHRVYIYRFENNVFTKLGNLTDPPAGASYGIAFSPDGKYFAVAHATTPFVSVYSFINEVATRLPYTQAPPPNTGTKVAFSSDGVFLGVSHNTAPTFSVFKGFPVSRIYPTSSAAILTALVGPTALLTGLNLLGLGQARDTVSAGNEATMDVWIQ